MTARLADDASFAAEWQARQTRSSRPPTPVAPAAKAVATEAPSAGDDSANETESPVEDGAPEWPDEETEAAMLVEVQEREVLAAPVTKRRAAREETDDTGDLPALDNAVQQVPLAVRQTLDTLFRAQFVQVRRVPAAVLKDRDAD